MAKNLDPSFTPRQTKDEEQNKNNEELKQIIQTLLTRIQTLENK